MTENTQKPIEKPWAVYSLAVPIGIGRIVKEDVSSLHIQDSENQRCPLQLCSSKSVQRFKKFDEAIEYFLSMSGQYTRRELKERVSSDFPNVMRKECLQNIHDILDSYANKGIRGEGPNGFIPLAQSQPKFTETSHILIQHPIDLEGYFPRK